MAPKGALYTITAGTEGDKQVYQILVERRLDLSDLKAYLPDDKKTWQKISFPNLIPHRNYKGLRDNGSGFDCFFFTGGSKGIFQ